MNGGEMRNFWGGWGCVGHYYGWIGLVGKFFGWIEELFWVGEKIFWVYRSRWG